MGTLIGILLNYLGYTILVTSRGRFFLILTNREMFFKYFSNVLGTLNPLLINRPTMPSRSRNIESWETIVDGLSSNECRPTLRKIARSPYIQVRSQDKSFQCSLKPLLKDNLGDV